jgi:hypothetical protein
VITCEKVAHKMCDKGLDQAKIIKVYRSVPSQLAKGIYISFCNTFCIILLSQNFEPLAKCISFFLTQSQIFL